MKRFELLTASLVWGIAVVLLAVVGQFPLAIFVAIVNLGLSLDRFVREHQRPEKAAHRKVSYKDAKVVVQDDLREFSTPVGQFEFGGENVFNCPNCHQTIVDTMARPQAAAVVCPHCWASIRITKSPRDMVQTLQTIIGPIKLHLN